MTTEELLMRAKGQLEGRDAEFPCKETCKAIIDLGRERDTAIEERNVMSKGKDYARDENCKLLEKMTALESELAKEKEASSKYRFMNGVAFDFIREVASGESGDGKVVAKRLFDLHKDDLGIRLMRCHCVNGESEAKAMFSEWCRKNAVSYTPEKFIEWLLSFV